MPRDSVFAAAAKQAEKLIDRKLRERRRVLAMLAAIDSELDKLRGVIDLAKNGVSPFGPARKYKPKERAAKSLPADAAAVSPFDPLKHQVHIPSPLYKAIEKTLETASGPMRLEDIKTAIKRTSGGNYTSRSITLQLARGKDLRRFRCEGRGPKASWLIIKQAGRIITMEESHEAQA